MKKFDLKEALQGKPVLLRNGCMAYITQVLSENSTEHDVSEGYRIKGYYLDSLHGDSISIKWKLNGANWDSKCDIVGMYGNVDYLIYKAFKENLPLKTRDGTKVFISTIVQRTNELTKDYPVFGYNNESTSYRWNLNGYYTKDVEHDLDIVGSWE